MRHDSRHSLDQHDGEQLPVPKSTPHPGSFPVSAKGEGALSMLRSSELAELCLWEMQAYHRGDASTDVYGVELLHRATIQGDQEAWTWVQHCFSGVVRGWLHLHPSRETAFRLESEENYVAQTFERFWQATTLTHQIEFRTLAAALQYLRASLNGAVLDMLRAYARPREVACPEPGELEAEDTPDGSEVWEILKALLPDQCEQRVAYLLFHCGLKPREIVRFCPQEFSDIHEIYRVRRNIMDRLRRNSDQPRWRFHWQEQR
jgi:hypothetical protein